MVGVGKPTSRMLVRWSLCMMRAMPTSASLAAKYT